MFNDEMLIPTSINQNNHIGDTRYVFPPLPFGELDIIVILQMVVKKTFHQRQLGWFCWSFQRVINTLPLKNIRSMSSKLPAQQCSIPRNKRIISAQPQISISVKCCMICHCVGVSYDLSCLFSDQIVFHTSFSIFSSHEAKKPGSSE